MARSANQKLKILYILELLKTHTDENHALTTQQIIVYLEKEGISAERKSIYTDISALTDYGYDIICSKSKEKGGYYLASRDFELPELKLLVDAVQSSRMITAKKTKQLITKLEQLTSPYEAKQLQRQVYVSERIKNSNESIYYSIDEIHKAMQNNKKISFQYYEWGVDKQMHFRKNGVPYEISPFFLIWKDENYYLVAYDDKANIMKHYRVDKMTSLTVLKEDRKGNELAAQMRPDQYAQQKFGMYAGEEETVTLEFPQEMSGVIFDRFGKNIAIRERENGLYSARAQLAVSPQFYGWLTGLPKVRVLAPLSVVRGYIEYLDQIREQYENIEIMK